VGYGVVLTVLLVALLYMAFKPGLWPNRLRAGPHRLSPRRCLDAVPAYCEVDRPVA